MGRCCWEGVTPQATFYNTYKKNSLNSLTKLPDWTRGINLGRTWNKKQSSISYWTIFSRGCENECDVVNRQKCAKQTPPLWRRREEQNRQCTYKRNNEARSCKKCWRTKAISITFSECVSVALGIQQAKRIRRIVFSSVVCFVLPYFFILSFKRHDLGGGWGGIFEHKMCVVDCFFIFCPKHFSF